MIQHLCTFASFCIHCSVYFACLFLQYKAQQIQKLKNNHIHQRLATCNVPPRMPHKKFTNGMQKLQVSQYLFCYGSHRRYMPSIFIALALYDNAYVMETLNDYKPSVSTKSSKASCQPLHLLHKYTHIQLFQLFQLIQTNFRVLISYLMSVFVYCLSHHSFVQQHTSGFMKSYSQSKVDALKQIQCLF